MKFWDNAELDPDRPALGYTVSLRGKVAIELVEHWGTVAGHDAGEDSVGRAKIDLLPPADVVTRALEMADLIVAGLEEREWIRPGVATTEEVAERAGRAEHAKYEQRFEARKAETSKP